MYSQLVMAGGGGRCTWQLGFLSVVRDELQLDPSVVCAVSAGSLMACIMVACEEDEARDYFRRAFGANEKNAYWERLFSPEPVFPHYAIYRQAIRDLFGDRMDRLHSGPDIRVAVAHFPGWLETYSAFVVGAMAYNFDKRVKKALHPNTAKRLGYSLEFGRVRDCTDVEQLADLILQSSCSPPMTPVMRRNGRAVLDGGVVDNVPCAGLDDSDGDVLVLLSRQYPNFPQVFRYDRAPQRRTYVQPSQPVPVKAWDYTNPDLIEATLELGKRDGAAFLAAYPPVSST